MATIYEEGVKAGGLEQRLPPVILYSDPDFPDRTSALLQGDIATLVGATTTALRRLASAGATRFVICCYTLHATLALLDTDLRNRVISLPDVAVDELAGTKGRVLLLGTTGSRKLRVFEQSRSWPAIRDRVVRLTAGDQADFHELLYGLKAGADPEVARGVVIDLCGRYGVDTCLAAGMHGAASGLTHHARRTRYPGHRSPAVRRAGAETSDDAEHRDDGAHRVTITLSSPARLGGHVGIVTGGVSRERDRSLLSGAAVKAALEAAEYSVLSIDTSMPGFLEDLRRVDVAFLAIAGKYAEDGKLQGLLETLHIPYTGSGVLASAVGMNKPMTKAVAAGAGVPVARHVLVEPGTAVLERAAQIDAALGLPVVIKPVAEGGSVSVYLARTSAELVAALEAEDDTEPMLAEEYMSGTMATVGVIETASGLQALPVLGIESSTDFYDWSSKRQADLHRYECPAQVPVTVRDELQAHARTIHEILNCGSHSRSDFIVRPDGTPCFLEVNTLPGLSREGNLATMATAAGLTYERLIGHLLACAMNRPSYVS
jgi:D-alanine-D-alanine ligase